MNIRFFVLGFILLAAVAFARPSVPGVDLYMQSAYCGYDAEGSLFSELRAGILHYNESKSGELTTLGGHMSDEWDAMLDCGRAEIFSVSSLTPQQIAELQCVRSHYLVFNGYMNQVKALYFRTAFYDMAYWPDVLSGFQSYNADWMSCLSARA